MALTEKEKLGDIDFCWGKKRGVGGKKKEVQFYESFTYDGVEYTLYDCVYMQNKDTEAEPYIGKLIKIWRNPDKSKKIKVQWFFRPSEISYWLQYHNVQALENEVFIADGEGLGLANINPVEAIAGKCFVVCISRDSRNPQPSAEQLQMADYIFHRTFDVGQCIILDKMDDKVGGLEVRFVFNIQDNAGPNLGSDRTVDDSRIAMVCGETSQFSGTKPHVLENIIKDGHTDNLDMKEVAEAKLLLVEDETFNGHKADSLAHLKPTLGKRPVPVVDVLGGEVATSIKEKNNSADVNAATEQVKGSILPANHEVVGKPLECGAPDLDGNPLKRPKLNNSAKVTKGEDVIKVEQLTSNREDLKTSSVASPKEKTNPEPRKDVVRVEKHTKFIKDSSNLDERPSKKPKVHESVMLYEDKNKNNLKKANIKSGGSEAKDSLVAGSSLEDKRKARLGQNSIGLLDGPSKEKRDGKISKLTKNLTELEKETIHTEDKPMEKMSKLTKSFSKLDKGPPPNEMREEKMGEHNNNSIGADKDLSKETFSGKMRMPMESSFGVEKGPSEKLDKKMNMLPNNNSAKISKTFVDVDEKVDGKIYEVTQKPDAETGKWYRSLEPWENRMVSAQEKRRLVLLQNLDPQYTSGEVEDIVWSAFKETCTAKVVQRTVFSSPHYGQALVIFKTREVAERVVEKLNGGCLIISNRPLVGCIANLPPPIEKQCSFVGHLSIDKIKLQMQREKKDAVSTSHCSQPNTVEYELAMEWCLLQSRSNRWWERLHKRQGEEFKKHMDNLKSNSTKKAI